MNKTRLILVLIFCAFALSCAFFSLPGKVGAERTGAARKTKPAADHRSVSVECPEIIGSNSVQVILSPNGEAPEWMAFALKRNDSGESGKHRRDYEILDDAKWLPFSTNMAVDLGPGDGKRELYFGFKYKGETNSRFITVESVLVRTDKPVIVITSPKEPVTFQPLVQVKGFINKDAVGIRYSVYDEKGNRTASGEGLVNNRYFDKATWQFSTNYFTCYDVELRPGTNRFVIECKDTTGFSGSTNFQIVFTTTGDTNPPNFKLEFPKDKNTVNGSQLTLHGPGDDATATIQCWATDDEGHTEMQSAFCERNGYIWVEEFPLKRIGQHQITVVASDVAGNSSWTNLTITKSADRLEMDPIRDSQQLWEKSVDVVTGFSSRTNCEIFVNGVKAELKPDGHWTAKNVPVKSANGGTATFHIRAEPDDKSAETNIWIPTVYGKAMESLKPALSRVEVDTNEYDHYVVSLGFTNLSGEDIRGKWVLPTEEARFTVHLYDEQNNEVQTATLLSKKNYGKSLSKNLNIRHLQKVDYKQIGGVIDFFKASAIRTATLKLDEFFQIPPAGKYRFEIVPRLFRIAEDGRLIPTEFSAVSTMLQIREQESEFVMFLNKLQRQGKLVWGATTNSLSIGLTRTENLHRSDGSLGIQVFLNNSADRGSSRSRLIMPPQNEAFRMDLYDSEGKPVPKTRLGKQSGQPSSPAVRKPRGSLDVISTLLGLGGPRRQRNRYILAPAKEAVPCLQFKLEDYFQISRTGKYRLNFEQRFYGWDTNSQKIQITMPAVTLPIEIKSLP